MRRRTVDVALLAEGVDRNTYDSKDMKHGQVSPSSRRAWIEIGGRNYITQKGWQVALLTEGVDRNTPGSTIWLNTPASPSSRRAWIEISKWDMVRWDSAKSPSSRRAWIEMLKVVRFEKLNFVALLTEGVDRNRLDIDTCGPALPSPSSQRVWIEIPCPS